MKGQTRVIRRPAAIEEPIQVRKAVVVEKRNQHVSISDQVAGDRSLVNKNYLYPGGMIAFPEKPAMRVVDKHYPYAIGGPLFIDEPQMEYEIALCKEKAVIMKNLGHRYAYIAPKMSLSEVYSQLEKR